MHFIKKAVNTFIKYKQPLQNKNLPNLTIYNVSILNCVLYKLNASRIRSVCHAKYKVGCRIRGGQYRNVGGQRRRASANAERFLSNVTFCRID